ncbi:MAG: hypothetical protein ACOCYV_00295 [Planctomycetota bacterium]
MNRGLPVIIAAAAVAAAIPLITIRCIGPVSEDVTVTELRFACRAYLPPTLSPSRAEATMDRVAHVFTHRLGLSGIADPVLAIGDAGAITVGFATPDGPARDYRTLLTAPGQLELRAVLATGTTDTPPATGEEPPEVDLTLTGIATPDGGTRTLALGPDVLAPPPRPTRSDAAEPDAGPEEPDDEDQSEAASDPAADAEAPPVTTAAIALHNQRPALALAFSDPAAERVAALTSAIVARRAAGPQAPSEVALRLDGQLVSVAEVVRPLEHRLILTGLPRERLDQLVAVIGGGPLPTPVDITDATTATRSSGEGPRRRAPLAVALLVSGACILACALAWHRDRRERLARRSPDSQPSSTDRADDPEAS